MFSFSMFTPPQESYSRQLDEKVASQEYPYGMPDIPNFSEISREIASVERSDVKGETRKFRKGKSK